MGNKAHKVKLGDKEVQVSKLGKELLDAMNDLKSKERDLMSEQFGLTTVIEQTKGKLKGLLSLKNQLWNLRRRLIYELCDREYEKISLEAKEYSLPSILLSVTLQNYWRLVLVDEVMQVLIDKRLISLIRKYHPYFDLIQQLHHSMAHSEEYLKILTIYRLDDPIIRDARLLFKYLSSADYSLEEFLEILLYREICHNRKVFRTFQNVFQCSITDHIRNYFESIPNLKFLEDFLLSITDDVTHHQLRTRVYDKCSPNCIYYKNEIEKQKRAVVNKTQCALYIEEMTTICATTTWSSNHTSIKTRREDLPEANQRFSEIFRRISYIEYEYIIEHYTEEKLLRDMSTHLHPDLKLAILMKFCDKMEFYTKKIHFLLHPEPISTSDLSSLPGTSSYSDDMFPILENTSPADHPISAASKRHSPPPRRTHKARLTEGPSLGTQTQRSMENMDEERGGVIHASALGLESEGRLNGGAGGDDGARGGRGSTASTHGSTIDSTLRNATMEEWDDGGLWMESVPRSGPTVASAPSAHTGNRPTGGRPTEDPDSDSSSSTSSDTDMNSRILNAPSAALDEDDGDKVEGVGGIGDAAGRVKRPVLVHRLPGHRAPPPPRTAYRPPLLLRNISEDSTWSVDEFPGLEGREDVVGPGEESSREGVNNRSALSASALTRAQETSVTAVGSPSASRGGWTEGGGGGRGGNGHSAWTDSDNVPRDEGGAHSGAGDDTERRGSEPKRRKEEKLDPDENKDEEIVPNRLHRARSYSLDSYALDYPSLPAPHPQLFTRVRMSPPKKEVIGKGPKAEGSVPKGFFDPKTSGHQRSLSRHGHAHSGSGYRRSKLPSMFTRSSYHPDARVEVTK